MRLLYAEDEEDLNKVVTKKLTEEGFSVDSCFNGREAIDNVQFTEYDADDNEYGQVYEVEFKANGYKYKYEIDANNGTILKNTKKKLKTTVKTTTSKSSAYIGVKAAKAVALKHAKLTGTKVTYTKAKLTTDDGVKVYDIEFRTADNEYDYEINAKTGKVVEFSVEPIDYNDED